MACVCHDKNGTRRVQFVHPTDQRRVTIRLGKVSLKYAGHIRFRVEQLLQHRAMNWPWPNDLCEWVKALDQSLRQKFEKAELLDTPEATAELTLSELWERAIETRANLKAGTTINWNVTKNVALAFFGNVPVSRITTADAERWRKTMLGTSRPSTIHKYLQRARAAFQLALENGQIDHNPFDTVRQRIGLVNERQHYIPMELFWHVLEHAPDDTWRVLLVLARIQGMRTPSEPFSLRWRDITWPDANGQGGSILITSPKGEHSATKAQRRMPLFPEAVPHLRQLQRSAPASEWVIPDHVRLRASGATGWRGANLRTRLISIVKDSFADPWPKPFHNLRASCETDLCRATGNITLACQWLGNSTSVAVKHYVNPVGMNMEVAKLDCFSQGGAQAAQKAAQ